MIFSTTFSTVPLAAVEHRTDLDRSGLDDCHCNFPSGECDADTLVMASGTHNGLIGQTSRIPGLGDSKYIDH